MSFAKNEKPEKKILVFSSTGVSDLGIDMAGASHMHYSTSVQIIPLPLPSHLTRDRQNTPRQRHIMITLLQETASHNPIPCCIDYSKPVPAGISVLSVFSK